MCRMLRAERVSASACGTLKEELVVPEPEDLSPNATDDATREKHRIESEIFETGKDADWQALAEFPTHTTSPSIDPDEGGWPNADVPSLGESGVESKSVEAVQHSARNNLERLLSNSIVNRKPMVPKLPRNVVLSECGAVYRWLRPCSKCFWR